MKAFGAAVGAGPGLGVMLSSGRGGVPMLCGEYYEWDGGGTVNE